MNDGKGRWKKQEKLGEAILEGKQIRWHNYQIEIVQEGRLERVNGWKESIFTPNSSSLVSSVDLKMDTEEIILNQDFVFQVCQKWFKCWIQCSNTLYDKYK